MVNSTEPFLHNAIRQLSKRALKAAEQHVALTSSWRKQQKSPPIHAESSVHPRASEQSVADAPTSVLVVSWLRFGFVLVMS